MNSLFGGKPSTPKIIQQKEPLKLEQTDLERKNLFEQMAKQRRATLLSMQNVAEPATLRMTLGGK